MQRNFMLESISLYFKLNTISYKFSSYHLQQLINPENKYISHNLSQLIFPQFN